MRELTIRPWNFEEIDLENLTPTNGSVYMHGELDRMMSMDLIAGFVNLKEDEKTTEPDWMHLKGNRIMELHSNERRTVPVLNGWYRARVEGCDRECLALLRTEAYEMTDPEGKAQTIYKTYGLIALKEEKEIILRDRENYNC